MPDELPLREATSDDIPALIANRRRMVEEMWTLEGRPFGSVDLDETDEATAAYLRQTWAAGTSAGWLAEADSQIVASGIVTILDIPPRYSDASGKVAYVYGVYTAPTHRRQGLARRMVQASIEWARGRGVRCVELGASAAGRRVYESLGFGPTSHMRLRLD